MAFFLGDDDFEAHWETVVNTMAEGLFVVNPEGAIVFINRAAEILTGYGRDEVIGKPCTTLESEG